MFAEFLFNKIGESINSVGVIVHRATKIVTCE